MSQRGFTLIEMAFVVLIIGLMVGGGLLTLGPMYDKARVNQTNTTLDQVENALVLFAVRNNRLPCPADGSIKAGLVNYGLEQVKATGGPCSTSLVVANSVIPWITLGIPEGYSLDAWGNRISYFPSDPTLLTGAIGVTTTGQLQRSGTTYPTGPFLTVSDAVSGQSVTPASPGSNDQAAYVIVSHGKSGWFGWKGGILQSSSIALTNKACNSTPATCKIGPTGVSVASFASGGPIGPFPPSPNNTLFFDDLVRWRSPAFIIQLCGSGACGNP